MSEVVQKIKRLATKQAFILLFKIFITIVLVMFLLNYISYEKIILPLISANYYLVTAASLLVVLNVYLQFCRWEIICNKVLLFTDRKKIFLSLFYGFSGGMITPMRIGEYVGRTFGVKSISAINVTAATLADKIFPLFIILFAGASASVFFLAYIGISSFLFFSILILEIIIFSSLYFLLFYNDELKNKLLNRISAIKFLKFRFEEINILSRIERKTSNQLMLISVIAFATFILQYGLLIAAFSNGGAIINYCWIGMLVIFVKTIIPPITFGELGVRETASVFFVTFFGLSEAVGFNASMFLFIINVLLPSVAGMLLFLRRD